MIKSPGRISRGGTPEIRIDHFLGVDYSTVASQIAQNRASDMENMMLDTQGMLQQIPGFRKAITGTVSTGTTPVRMLAYNRPANKMVKSHGGKLYKFSPGGAETELYASVTDARMRAFVMGDYQYYYNGTDFLRWDGSAVVATVEASAYAPTTVVGRAPTGGGTVLEAVNLINPCRKNSFIGNGSATIYQLDTTNLDATTITITVGGVAKVENTDFTVNRTTGAVTFSTAPADGSGVDNVIITFYKTVTGYANRIKNCTTHVIFGIGNNMRVFMTGNPNYRNTDWACSMQDPTYWPDTSYTEIGSKQVAIKGYAPQLGVLHILKESSQDDPTIWTRRAEEYTDGTLYFPVRPNNASVGCLATDTIRVMDDVPAMLTDKGVYRITSTSIADERGLQHISGCLDAELLNETDLDDAVAFDFEGRYGIAVNDYIYVIDYNNGGEAYRWKGFPASCFCEQGGELYFGANDSGNCYTVNRIGDTDNTNLLDTTAISSWWYSKMFSMDKANYYKMIDSLSVTMVPVSARSAVDIYYKTNKKNDKLVKSITMTKLDIDDIDLDDFSLLISDLPQTINREVNVSDFIYFQVIIKNSAEGKGLAISNITIPYSFAGEI